MNTLAMVLRAFRIVKSVHIVGLAIVVQCFETSGASAQSSSIEQALEDVNGLSDSIQASPSISEPVDGQSNSVPTLISTSHRGAIGINLGWLTRKDYGAKEFRRFSPEVVGYFYGAIPSINCHFRGGLRAAHTHHQPEMPQAVRMEETDSMLLGEFGLLREWYMVPSVSIGLGVNHRTIVVKTRDPIETVDSRLNRKQNLLVGYFQFGAGLPLHQATFMIEPMIRYQLIQYDRRSKWFVGVETTYGFE